MGADDPSKIRTAPGRGDDVPVDEPSDDEVACCPHCGSASQYHVRSKRYGREHTHDPDCRFWCYACSTGFDELEYRMPEQTGRTRRHGLSRTLVDADPDHFATEEHVVEAPFTGLIVGVLENPVALPGHPLCHLVRISDETRAEIEQEISRGEFDGYRSYGQRWMADEEEAE